jgi:hypothetical protein
VRFIHYQVTAGPGDTIQVTLDAQANVWLMDTINYQKYRMGKVIPVPAVSAKNHLSISAPLSMGYGM